MKQTNLTRSHSDAVTRGLVAATAARSYSWVEELANDSGTDFVEGNVVVVLADGTLQLADTVNEPRPTGVCLDDIEDGDSGQVCFGGPVDLVLVTGAVTAGTYGQTSTTPGEAQTASGPAVAFCEFTDSGTTPSAFLWGGRGGGGAMAGGGGGGGVSGSGLYTNGAAGSSLSLILDTYTVFDITLTANLTLTFTSPPTDGLAHEWIFILRQGGAGSYTVTWPGAVSWQDSDGTGGGSAPTLFTTVDAVDVFRITTLDDGTSYGGASVRGDHRLLLYLTSGDPHTQYILKSFFAAKGDLLGASANDTPAIVSVGTNGQLLQSDSTASAGVSWVDAPTTGGAHAHVASETHLSDGSTTTYTLDEVFEPGSVIAWNTTVLARLGVTETAPDQATVSAAGSSGDSIVFDYAASIA